MFLDFVKQLSEADFLEREFDYLICASGFEERASHLLKILPPSKLINTKKICFSFNDRKVYSRDHNDKLFKKWGFKFQSVGSSDILDYTNLYHFIFQGETRKSVSIAVDYSCMTSVLYASILKYFNSFSEKFESVTIFFSYSQAKFTTPGQFKALHFNHPIPLFEPIQSTDKRIALVIGLGYEKDKALGLFEYFQNDSNDIYLFITGKRSSDKFYDEVTSNNSEFIGMMGEDNVIFYDLGNITHLLSTMDSLVDYLVSNNFRVVIAPLGPKVFTLASMLINMSHKEVTTYRLSGGEGGAPINKFADEQKELIVAQVDLKSTLQCEAEEEEVSVY